MTLFNLRAVVLGTGLACAAAAPSWAGEVQAGVPARYAKVALGEAFRCDLSGFAGLGDNGFAVYTVPAVPDPNDVICQDKRSLLSQRTLAGATRLNYVGGADWVFNKATKVNRKGQVVGAATSEVFYTLPFVTGPRGKDPVLLGTLGGSNGVAYAVNTAGVVAGQAQTAAGDYHPFVTGAGDHVLRDLGTLGGTRGSATDVNTTGRVVGSASNAAGRYHAFITAEGSDTLVDLGALTPSGSFGVALNDRAQVVGNTCETDACYTTRPFVTGPGGTGMQAVKPIAGVNNPGYGRARDINAAGQVVGGSTVALPSGWNEMHAFVTDADGVTAVDLNTRVTLADGWYLSEALSINTAGEILVLALNPTRLTESKPYQRLFLLCPDATCKR